jgi:hypothetical protein
MCPVSINTATAECIPLIPFHVVRQRNNVAKVARHAITSRLANQFQIIGDTIVKPLGDAKRQDTAVRKLISSIKAGGFRVTDEIEGIKPKTLRTYVWRLKKCGAVEVLPDGTLVWSSSKDSGDSLRFTSSGSLRHLTSEAAK